MANSYVFSSSKSALAIQLLFLLLGGMTFAQLSPNYYANTCPGAMSIIKSAVVSAVAQEPRSAAFLLRLHFHDCFVQGCDASVLLDDTANFTGEKTAFPNVNSLKGFNVIDNIKARLENICPGVVSCADILTVAALEAVVAVGGPGWPVSLGRRDSTTANLTAANMEIPSPFLDLKELIASFARKGFTPKEMVALSGAHTIGKARCVFFRTRLYNESNINPLYAALLKWGCPPTGKDDNPANLDPTTPIVFDNAYYTNLILRKGLLHSDQQLYNGFGGAQTRKFSAML